MCDTGKILDKVTDLVLETFEKSSSEVKADLFKTPIFALVRINRKIFLAAISSSLVFNISAQNPRLDSLLSALKISNEDSNKVILLNAIAREYQGHDLTMATDYAKQALFLAKTLSYLDGEASAINNLGYALEVEGKYHEAINNYTKAASILEKSAPNSNKLAGIYNNIGIAYSSLANYPQALYYLKKALEIKIANGDEIKIAGQLHNIGFIYYYQGQLDKALENFFDALKIFEKKGDENKLAECFNSIGAAYSMQNNDEQALKYYYKSLEIFKKSGNKIQLANCYDNIGEIQLFQGLIDTAEENIMKALELRKSFGDKDGIADGYNELGDIDEARQQYKRAIEYKIQALKILEETGNKRDQADCLGDLGHICIKTRENTLAINYFEKSISIAEASDMKSVLYNSYTGITTAYENLGQYKKALAYHRKYSAISDSIFNESKNKKISELEMQYQVGKKEQENTLLAKENQLQALTIQSEKEKRKNQFIILAGVIAFILFVSLFFYTRYRYHHLSQLEEEKRKQEQLRFKMVIDAEEKERARIASELHDGLGHLLSSAKLNISGLEDNANGAERKLFDNSMNLIDEACNEVRTISHNLMPAALMRQGLISAVRNLVRKINDTEQIKVELNDTLHQFRLDESTEIALYRIIQEVLNNMLKYSEAKNISVNFEKENRKFLLTLKDNGIGFDVSKIQASNGIGWKSIFSRVDMMNGSIDVDSQKNKGTTVKIEIPV